IQMSVTPYSHKAETGRVLVGMSGGAHSAITAALLKTQGFEVHGAFIDLGVPEMFSGTSRCNEPHAAKEAERLAAKVGIQLQTLNGRDLFANEVLEAMVLETAQGRRPNPCIACYRSVKFA